MQNVPKPRWPPEKGRERLGERRERKEVRERQRAGQPTCCMRSTIIKANFFSSAFYPKVLKRKKYCERSLLSFSLSLSLALSHTPTLTHTHSHSHTHTPTHPHSHTLTWVVAFMESDLPFLRAGLPRCCKHIQPSE